MMENEKPTNAQADEFAREMDQENLLRSLAEMGTDGFALQQRAEQLIQDPEAFLNLLNDFEAMKAETLTAISELFGKVDAAGREKLLEAKELLKFVKLAIEALSKDLLEAGQDIAEGGKDIVGGILSLLLTGKGRRKFVLVATLILASCTSFPSVVKTAVAPDVAYAAGLGTGTPTATLSVPVTKEPTLPPTKRPTATPEATATEVAPTYDFSDAFFDLKHDKQWPLKETKPGEFSRIACEIDFDSIRKTNFKFADLIILRVGDAYLVSADNQTQVISIPLAAYNPKTDEFFSINQMQITKGKGMPGDAYIDNGLEGYFEDLQKAAKENKATLQTTLSFNTKNQPNLIAFFAAATAQQGSLNPEFITSGKTDAFPDFPKAENFAVPSSADTVLVIH